VKVSDLTAQDLLKTGGIISSPSDAPLAHALSLLNSSHDAVFVVEKSQVLGVINPYHVLFKSKYPPETKLRHCLFSPPKLHLDTPLAEIASLMVESKVYFLPVFSPQEEWVGIVTKNRILESLSASQLPPQFNRIRQPKRMITISPKESIGKARNRMQQSGVSRLLVTDTEGDLLGILTRYDLRVPYAQPAESVSQYSKVGQKTSNSDDPIDPYMKKNVITAPHMSAPQDLIRLMLDKNVGSVVLVNDLNRPVGFVSTKDVLQVLAKSDDEAIENIHISTTDGFLVTPLFKQLLTQSFDKLKRHHDVERLDITVKVEKNASKNIARHTITLKADRPGRKSLLVAKAEHPEWRKALSAALHKLKSQVDL